MKTLLLNTNFPPANSLGSSFALGISALGVGGVPEDEFGQPWDLMLDAHGNIAVASNPYSLAQDAASQIKLFKGELWYDTTQGVPYWEQILGKLPPISVMKNAFVAAAMMVPEVIKARCFISSALDSNKDTNGLHSRRITGQVQILDESGRVTAASFF